MVCEALAASSAVIPGRAIGASPEPTNTEHQCWRVVAVYSEPRAVMDSGRRYGARNDGGENYVLLPAACATTGKTSFAA